MNNQKGGAGIVITIIILVLIIAVLASALFFLYIKPSMSEQNNGNPSTISNPILHLLNQNKSSINQISVIERAVLEFNASYVNYLIDSIGASNLHSAIGFGNPKIEFVIDEETWNSELGNIRLTERGNSDDPDIRIKMSKEEAVKALMSNDQKLYMKQSVIRGNTQIEMIAGKVELYSKGYLDLYNNLKSV